MNNYQNKAKYDFEAKEEDISCKTTIWKLYKLAPSMAWFSIQVLSEESSDTVLDSLSFSKNNADEKKAGEKRLYELVGKAYREAPFARITCEIKSGLGCDYIVKVYV